MTTPPPKTDAAADRTGAADVPSTVAISPAWGVVRVTLTVLLAVAGCASAVRLLADGDPVTGGWTLQMMLATAAVVAACWYAVHRRLYWTAPMDRLVTLARLAHEGESPIESLSGVRGGVRPLVPVVQSLLRELRQQQVVIAELNFEMQQKVANRTDALERVIGSLRQQATRDVLTGLFNRRFLEQFLPQAVVRARTVRTDLCLLMVDVDHFKVLNDTLGHAAGDDLLRAVGQLVRSAIRGEDVAFRCGGDEFVILLPGYDARAGRGLADRLTSLVDALAKTIKVEPRPRLSIGLATLSGLGPRVSHEQLLAEADRSLYEIKDQRHGADPEPATRSRRRGPAELV